ELQKSVTVLDFPLPDVSELNDVLQNMIRELQAGSEVKINLKPGEKEMILKAALGLTLSEAENVLAKTVIQTKELSADSISVILSEKEQIVKKSGVLEYYAAEDQMNDIGGLENLKAWLRKRALAFTDEARDFGLPSPRGALLIGVQGCGKSLCAKAVSQLWKMPLLRFDVGRVFSSLVGSSESNIRQAITIAESVAPSILWVDEIEKAFSGIQSSGFSDAGTTARVLGTFITWLQEKKSPVFVIATANRIDLLPPELLRKGRLDEIFFVDLPGARERKEIFEIHLRKRKKISAIFDFQALAVATDGFSGSEIEQVVISAMFDAFEAGTELTTALLIKNARDTVPLSVTMSSQIDALRKWAGSRARPAS
ncbi:MAG: AAA family ATPase, partial [bacterium]|nr:AAA family ATPase [bacterium]